MGEGEYNYKREQGKRSLLEIIKSITFKNSKYFLDNYNVKWKEKGVYQFLKNF